MSTDPERRARFEAIVSEVTAPLDRYLRRRVNTADAADVLNDTLLVVWRRLDEVPEPPLPWCYGVARRCLANARRGDRRRLRLVERIGRRRIDDQAGDPQREIDAGDPVLHAALGDLTTSEAEIVRLWAWEQLEPREIATVLGSTSNSVSVALTRAKRKLAASIERQDPGRSGHRRDGGFTGPTGGPR